MTVKGSASAKAKVSKGKVTVVVSAKVKITEKILGKTVTLLSASGKLELSKKVTELTPCVDVKAEANPFSTSGKLCLRGNKVCYEKGVVHVSFRGKKHKIATIAKECVSLQ
jgi:hypothetical protein